MTLLVSEEHLSAQAYQFIAELVYEHSRIRLGSDKQALVSGRLAKRLRQLGLQSFDAYCELLRSAAGAEELGPLVDLISTNHTHFFRESAHLDYLRDVILPEFAPRLITRRVQLKVWSAACSSGEEPYSIAITLEEYARLHGAMGWQIDATDISHRILEHASAGIYSVDRVRLPSQDLLPRYFQKGVGTHSGQYRVKEALRQGVTFRHLNLLDPSYPVSPDQHVIFCRNVMIYFDHETQEQLVNQLSGQLSPGGYLIVGHSESLLGIRHSLKQVKPGIYRRMQS